MKRKVTIILPTYNEAENIEQLITRLFSSIEASNNWELSIVVVDSSSPDGTGAIVESMKKKYPYLHLLKTPKEGLGKAYVNGFTYALSQISPYVCFEMDADFSHPPELIPQFLSKIEKGADMVLGSRYIRGGSIPKDWAVHRKIFSTCANIFVRFGFMKLRVTDWTTGFRAIKTWLIKDALSYVSTFTGYVFQVAFLDFAVNKHAHIEEVPLAFKDRKKGISKINSVQYIVQTLFYVLTHSSFIKFVIVGCIGFIIDFGISYFFIEKVHTALWIATIISTETAIISNFFLNNFWSFSHKQIERTFISYLFNFAKFNLVSVGSILIQTLGVALIAGLLGTQYWYIYKVIIIICVIIPYSYFLYSKVIWKK